MGLLDLPTELLERILFHVADPAALRAVSRTCKCLAALTAATSPLWPALLRSRVDLTRRPGPATDWETTFFCYWDDTYGDETDSVAFAPPLARVRGWTGGDAAAGGGGGGSGGGSAPAAAAVAAAAAAAAGVGGDGTDADGRFLYIDNRRAAGGAAAAQPAADAGAARGGDADRAVKRHKIAAAAAAAAAAPADEDPRLLYAALVAATRAGVATADRDLFDVWDRYEDVWGSEARHTPPHVWVVRVDAPGLPWPPPPSAARAAAAAAEATSAVAAVAKHVADAAIAPEALPVPITAADAAAASAAAATPSAAEADVVAAGVALLTAAGAAPPILPTVAAKGTAEDVRAGGLSCASATSGAPGDATYMRIIGGPLDTILRDGDTIMGITTGPGTVDQQQRAAGMNDAVRRLLGDRPALVFTFGEEAMNPVGGVVAVAWSQTLIVGLLMELVRT